MDQRYYQIPEIGAYIKHIVEYIRYNIRDYDEFVNNDSKLVKKRSVLCGNPAHGAGKQIRLNRDPANPVRQPSTEG